MGSLGFSDDLPDLQLELIGIKYLCKKHLFLIKQWVIRLIVVKCNQAICRWPQNVDANPNNFFEKSKVRTFAAFIHISKVYR